MKAENKDKFEALQTAAAESKAKILAEKAVLAGIRKQIQDLKADK